MCSSCAYFIFICEGGTVWFRPLNEDLLKYIFYNLQTYLHPHPSCSPLLLIRNHQGQWFHLVPLDALGPSIVPTKELKYRNYIHFPDEAEIQRLRYLSKHVTMATWLWGDQSPFVKVGASLFSCHLGWLLLSFHSQVSHSGQYILRVLTLLVSSRERTGMQICDWLTPKPGLSVIPSYLLKLQNYEAEKEGLFSIPFIHSCIQQTFMDHLLCDTYCAGRWN